MMQQAVKQFRIAGARMLGGAGAQQEMQASLGL